jgi:hypothetical protein
MKRIRKFFYQSKSDRQLLLITFILLGIIRFGLWLLPFPTFRRVLAIINKVTSQQQKVEQSSKKKLSGRSTRAVTIYLVA